MKTMEWNKKHLSADHEMGFKKLDNLEKTVLPWSREHVNAIFETLHKHDHIKALDEGREIHDWNLHNGE